MTKKESLTKTQGKHTPGPWQSVCGRNSDNWPVHYVHANNHGIATLIFQPEEGRYTQEQSEANARLIAAGPELLEAARAALADMDGEGYESREGVVALLLMAIHKAEGKPCRCHEVESGDCENCPPRWARNKARAAIAKAEKGA